MTASTSVERRRSSARLRSTLQTVALISSALIGMPVLASDYLPPKVDTRTPTGVNLADGSFALSDVDISIGTLAFQRVHQGGLRDPELGPLPFGPRMSHNLNIYVANNRGIINRDYGWSDRYKPIVHLGDSASGVYMHDIYNSSYVEPSSIDAESGTLSYANDAYTYIAQDGTVYSFDSGNGISTIAYPNGRKLTFSYSAQRTLISDSQGYALLFEKNSSGLITSACGFDLSASYVTTASSCGGAPVRVTYGYTNGHLTSVTDVLGRVTTYAWSGDTITCVTPPGYSTCKIANEYQSPIWDGQYQVTKQTLADGSTWAFTYSGNYDGRDPDAGMRDTPTTGTTQVTDPMGKVSSYLFAKTSPYAMTDPNNQTTSYRYTGGTDLEENSADPTTWPDLPEGQILTEVDLPEGNKYVAGHGGPFNALTSETWTAKPSSGLADAVIQYGYSCPNSILTATCTKPIWKKDPSGNQTDFGYTSFGAVAYEVQPAPTANAARPFKLYTYASKYAYVQNGSGSLVPGSAPLWLPTTLTECQVTGWNGSSTPVCDGNAPQLVTTYEYGPDGTADNLLLRGKVVTADGQSLRACYRYDPQGNKIAETSPRAGLTSCP